VADTFGNEINVGPPPVTLRKRRSFGLIGVLALLLLFGAAGGLLWLNLDTVTDMLHGVASPASSSGSNSDVLASASEPSVSAADFAAFQQQTGSSIQSATDLLNAQQTELKRLSDQIQGLTMQVSSLTTRIEQMQQGRAVSAPAAGAPVAPVAAAPVAAPRPAPTAARRRPPANQPAGAISVGGAPLQAAPAR
jgi:TolA-binding protein